MIMKNALSDTLKILQDRFILLFANNGLQRFPDDNKFIKRHYLRLLLMLESTRFPILFLWFLAYRQPCPMNLWLTKCCLHTTESLFSFNLQKRPKTGHKFIAAH